MLKDLKEKHVRWLGIPLLGTFLAFIFCDEAFPTIGAILKTIAVTLVYWHGTFSIINFFRKKYPEIENTSKRLLISAFCIIIFLIIADTILRTTFDYYFPELNWDIKSIPLHWIKNTFISFLVAMIYEMYYFYKGWNKSKLETQKLKTQQIVSQLETLKNQISPHFLFNSLNALAAIIPENQGQAVKFTEKLSEVYRYILQYKDKELVQLSTELEFIKSYLFLLKIRYPENLHVEYDISNQELKTHVAPLTLQILVENAIKHNVISKSEPLNIKIYTDNKGNVVVENRLNLKTIAMNSTKTGLDNIRKRYQYLSDRSINIINNQQLFMVSVPLIHFDSDKELVT